MGKRRRDESIQAKVRAAVTLNSLNSEFRFLGKDIKSVLDLCAGSGWMQLAVARISKGGFVLGVDLHPITPILGAISIQEDITTSECRDTIGKHMTENGFTGFDVVMRGGLSSDSSATTWDQASLLTKSIKLATKFLSPGGTFVTKMFHGAEDYNPMLYCLEQLFGRVVVTKPTSTSAETYILALNYKAPEKINPRLLVTRNLFSIKDEEEEEEAVVLASDFVWSETPLEVLEKACSLSFVDDACLSLKDHSLTTKRIKRICKNLRVLNKRRFMHLMKWRLHVREALSHAQKAKAADAKDGNKGNDDEIPDEMEYSEDIPKVNFQRIHGTTVMGVVVDDIDRAILIGTDGLLTGSNFRKEGDIKLKAIGYDMLCGMAGDYDFTEKVHKHIDREVWGKINANQSRPSVRKCARMLKSFYSDMLAEGNEFNQMWQKIQGKKCHAFLTLGGYEDIGGDKLIPHLWSATKLGAIRESKCCYSGSGGSYAEVFLKENIGRCNSIDNTIVIMQKAYLKAARYDCKTGGNFTIFVITPEEDLEALRRTPLSQRMTGNIDERVATLSELKKLYEDDFNDRSMEQTYAADIWGKRRRV
ncbi:hypothetical protein MKW92_047799 [Papaver armeniacum]|nr:hypothetical protein MKW92_047799 [Papaver armeniacum]